MPETSEIYNTIDLLLEENSSRRVEAKTIDGCKVWFKRYSNRNYSLGRITHRLLSFLVTQPFLKATPLYGTADSMHRELSKLHMFGNAGFKTPEVLGVRQNYIALSDEGSTLEQSLPALQTSDPEYHDQLLCEWAGIFGELHAKDLCHGRPHLRDIINREGDWIFLDFEEHPEEVMPLEIAQARDLLLIFHLLARKMIKHENLDLAMAKYRENAPAKVIDALRKILGDIGFLIKIAKSLSNFKRGKDVKRFVLATDYLKQNLELN